MNQLDSNMRTRVIETLSLIASADAQRRYQREVPNVDVPAELFNQWEEWSFPEDTLFCSAFQSDELEALHRFHDVLTEVCNETPQQLPPLTEFMSSGYWQKLSGAAKDALGALSGVDALR